MTDPVEQPSDAEPNQRLGREHRIRFRREFLRAYGEGRRAYGRLAVVFCYPRAEGGPWRLGVTVTKKAARAAVDRNRLRRLAREYFRRRGGLPEGRDFVVNLKQAATRASGPEVWADLDQIMARLGFGAAPPSGRAAGEASEANP